MAALSLIELLKGTSDPVASGVIEHIVTVDQLIAFLPFVSCGVRDSLVYRREKALPAVSKIGSGDTITPTAALTYTRATSFVRRMVVDQDIDILDAGAAGGMVGARADALGRAAKAVARTFGDDLIDGNSNFTATVTEIGSNGTTGATIVVGPGHDVRQPLGLIKYTHAGATVAYKAPGDPDYGTAVAYTGGVKVLSHNEDKWITVTFTGGALAANGVTTFALSGGDNEIDGLERLVADPSQVISATGGAGDALALATLDQLADLVKDRNGPKVYLMNAALKRKLAALLRAAGGATMTEFRDANSLTGNPVMQPVLTYNGIPVLQSDFIDSDESKGGATTLSSVYCATLGEGAGLCGLYSEASIDGDNGMQVISRAPTGLTMLNLGTVQNADVQRVRVKAYWGLMNKSELGLARAKNIITA